MSKLNYVWIKNLSQEGLALLRKEFYEVQKLHDEISKKKSETLEELEKEENIIRRIKILKSELESIHMDIDIILKHVDLIIRDQVPPAQQDFNQRLNDLHLTLNKNIQEISSIKKDMRNLKNKDFVSEKITQHIESDVKQFEGYLGRIQKLLDFTHKPKSSKDVRF